MTAGLTPGQRTVGTHIDVSHVAATPIGSPVTADVILETISGRRLRFGVAVRDHAELV